MAASIPLYDEYFTPVPVIPLSHASKKVLYFALFPVLYIDDSLQPTLYVLYFSFRMSMPTFTLQSRSNIVWSSEQTIATLLSTSCLMENLSYLICINP